MKRFYLTSLIVFLLFSAVKADQIDSIAWLIKEGNAERLSQLLSPTVEITLKGEENSYSKRQASEFLTKFFEEHKPVSSKLLHKVNSGSKFLFGVVDYTSNDGTYRIAYTIDITQNSTRLIELRIDPEKTK